MDALHATLLYGHPILGGVTIALAAWTGALGLRSRLPLRRAPALRAAHARLAPWVLALAVASWTGGAATTWLLRDDLESAASWHFRTGTGIVWLFAGAAILSRRIDRDPWARIVHPWLGAVAVLLGGVQVFLGLQIMPH